MGSRSIFVFVEPQDRWNEITQFGSLTRNPFVIESAADNRVCGSKSTQPAL